MCKSYIEFLVLSPRGKTFIIRKVYIYYIVYMETIVTLLQNLNRNEPSYSFDFFYISDIIQILLILKKTISINRILSKFNNNMFKWKSKFRQYILPKLARLFFLSKLCFKYKLNICTDYYYYYVSTKFYWSRRYL